MRDRKYGGEGRMRGEREGRRNGLEVKFSFQGKLNPESMGKLGRLERL